MSVFCGCSDNNLTTTKPLIDYSSFGFYDLGTKNQWAFIGEYNLSSPESAYAISSDKFAKSLSFNTSTNTLYVGWFDDDIREYDCIFLSNDSMQFETSEHAPKQTLNILARYNHNNILVLEVKCDETTVYMIPTEFLNFAEAETYTENGETYCRYSFKNEYLY
jgi:hypothetical protein